MMKALLLCAGYGTRLARDLEVAVLEEGKSEFQDLLNLPKPLLPIGSKPLITHWINLLSSVSKLTSICVVMNERFRISFEKWHETLPDAMKSKVNLLCDGTISNETRLGAVGCMQFAIEKVLGKDSDIMVIAGDTLFDKTFDMNDFVEKFSSLNADTPFKSLIATTSCTEEEVSKRGIVEEDDKTGQVTSFIEKPQPHETKSRRQSPCFYLIHSSHTSMIQQFLDEMRDQSLMKRDATGHFLKYLVENCMVYAYSVAKRYDVGGLQTYLDCCKDFQE